MSCCQQNFKVTMLFFEEKKQLVGQKILFSFKTIFEVLNIYQVRAGCPYMMLPGGYIVHTHILIFLTTPFPLSPILLNRFMKKCHLLADSPSPLNGWRHLWMAPYVISFSRRCKRLGFCMLLLVNSKLQQIYCFFIFEGFQFLPKTLLFWSANKNSKNKMRFFEKKLLL